jgi:hypothetical protein
VSKAILDFYGGQAPDNRGRRIHEIQSWPDDRLEAVHDYIQWLFPLPERSMFNWDAPLLEPETIDTFRERPDLQASLRASFLRMLRFYGFESREGIGRAANFEKRARNWLRPGNHNHLRITRILKSLRLLGLEAEAGAFLEALQSLYAERPDAISAETFRFWQATKTA